MRQIFADKFPQLFSLIIKTDHDKLHIFNQVRIPLIHKQGRSRLQSLKMERHFQFTSHHLEKLWGVLDKNSEQIVDLLAVFVVP